MRIIEDCNKFRLLPAGQQPGGAAAAQQAKLPMLLRIWDGPAAIKGALVGFFLGGQLKNGGPASWLAAWAAQQSPRSNPPLPPVQAAEPAAAHASKAGAIAIPTSHHQPHHHHPTATWPAGDVDIGHLLMLTSMDQDVALEKLQVRGCRRWAFLPVYLPSCAIGRQPAPDCAVCQILSNSHPPHPPPSTPSPPPRTCRSWCRSATGSTTCLPSSGRPAWACCAGQREAAEASRRAAEAALPAGRARADEPWGWLQRERRAWLRHV
jgi:hypothetical protein